MNGWPLVAGVFGVAACLSGCAAPPPPPPPTVVNLTLITTADANPTPDGKGAPLVLRVYQLASSANFNAAEFYPLYQTDGAALKTDMLHRDDFLLPPGQTKTQELTLTDPVKSIAVFGAYRDFQHATWRVAADVPAHKTTNITVTAGHDGVTLKAETPPPKPAS
jgi:type VI secretion system protein VasD